MINETQLENSTRLTRKKTHVKHLLNPQNYWAYNLDSLVRLYAEWAAKAKHEAWRFHGTYGTYGPYETLIDKRGCVNCAYYDEGLSFSVSKPCESWVRRMREAMIATLIQYSCNEKHFDFAKWEDHVWEYNGGSGSVEKARMQLASLIGRHYRRWLNTHHRKAKTIHDIAINVNSLGAEVKVRFGYNEEEFRSGWCGNTAMEKRYGISPVTWTLGKRQPMSDLLSVAYDTIKKCVR